MRRHGPADLPGDEVLRALLALERAEDLLLERPSREAPELVGLEIAEPICQPFGLLQPLIEGQLVVEGPPGEAASSAASTSMSWAS